MEIKDYTLHGDYYLADEIIPNKTWKEAVRMKKVITLPNSKKVIARTLSKEELIDIPKKEREVCDYWYWTSTPYNSNVAWIVNYGGGFYGAIFNGSSYNGGIRLGFHKSEIKQILDVE